MRCDEMRQYVRADSRYQIVEDYGAEASLGGYAAAQRNGGERNKVFKQSHPQLQGRESGSRLDWIAHEVLEGQKGVRWPAPGPALRIKSRYMTSWHQGSLALNAEEERKKVIR